MFVWKANTMFVWKDLQLLDRPDEILAFSSSASELCYRNLVAFAEGLFESALLPNTFFFFESALLPNTA